MRDAGLMLPRALWSLRNREEEDERQKVRGRGRQLSKRYSARTAPRLKPLGAADFGGGGFNRSAHSAGPNLQNEIVQMQGCEDRTSEIMSCCATQ